MNHRKQVTHLAHRKEKPVPIIREIAVGPARRAEPADQPVELRTEHADQEMILRLEVPEQRSLAHTGRAGDARRRRCSKSSLGEEFGRCRDEFGDLLFS